MNILEVIARLRDDIKAWVTNNLEALASAKANNIHKHKISDVNGLAEKVETPMFNLVAMGLPTIPSLGTTVSVNVDTAKILEAAANGIIRFRVCMSLAEQDVTVQIIETPIGNASKYVCTHLFDWDGTLRALTLTITSGSIAGKITTLN